MITATVYGTEEVRAKLERVPLTVRDRLRSTVSRLSIDLQRHVVQDKLSGQILRVRTGTLRRSINQHVEEDSNSITGIVGADMNAARYAAAHEYGFRGTVEVRAHVRTMREAFGRHLKSPREVMVRAHPMRMNLAERSYLRSSLRDMRSAILDAFEKSISEVLP